MKMFGGCLVACLFVIIFLIVGILRALWTVLPWHGKWRATHQSHRAEQQETPADDRLPFSDEGEYVDFEEVKDDNADGKR